MEMEMEMGMGMKMEMRLIKSRRVAKYAAKGLSDDAGDKMARRLLKDFSSSPSCAYFHFHSCCCRAKCN